MSSLPPEETFLELTDSGPPRPMYFGVGGPRIRDLAHFQELCRHYEGGKAKAASEDNGECTHCDGSGVVKTGTGGYHCPECNADGRKV